MNKGSTCGCISMWVQPNHMYCSLQYGPEPSYNTTHPAWTMADDRLNQKYKNIIQGIFFMNFFQRSDGPSFAAVSGHGCHIAFPFFCPIPLLVMFYISTFTSHRLPQISRRIEGDQTVNITQPNGDPNWVQEKTLAMQLNRFCSWVTSQH